jgi:hypothetical protein
MSAAGRVFPLPWLLAGLMGPTPLWGQAPAESGGRADLAVQGYYFGANGTLRTLSGLAAQFQYFFPKTGLITGKLEDYAGEGRWRAGDNVLELRGLVWHDHRWAFTGGDYRVPTGPGDVPFGNVFYPELSLRGAKISASRADREYSLFYGTYTLYAGPRIPFHTSTPQRILGAGFRYHPGHRLEVELRLLRLTTDLNRLAEEEFLFPVGRRLPVIHNASVQVKYRLAEHVRVFGELSASAARGRPASSGGTARPASTLFGGAWESEKWSARASFVDQGVLYLPVAGYFSGDRRGPSAELRYRPFRWWEMFGSASRFSNNLERDARVPTFRSATVAGGTSFELPWKLSATAQMTRLRFRSVSQESADGQSTDNRMWSASAGRPIGKQDIRLTIRDIQSRSAAQVIRQRSKELEDILQWKNVVLGGAIRLDSVIHQERRNSVFTRGHAQVRVKRVSVFAEMQYGRDLLNETAFATSAVRSSTAGISAPLPGGWSLQAEAFRSRLTTALNPANIFLLETRGMGFPALLAAFNQWSFFFRLTRSVHWGKPIPDQGLDRFTAERIPITGAIEGFVYERSRRGRAPAAGVPVSLDGQRTAMTDIEGRYHFSDVPEGNHKVGFPADELPAYYDPGVADPGQVLVKSRRTSRVDLEVFPLGQLCGTVLAPAGVPVEAVLLRLAPAGRYTTPEADGAFCFYNLREGDYEVQLDPQSLPPGTQLTTTPSLPLTLDLDAPPASPEFRLEPRVVTKPVRQVLTDLRVGAP